MFVLVHVLCGMELACAPGTPWWTHLTYLFQHAGWWHLAVNALSFVGMSRLVARFLPYGPVLCIGVAVAVSAMTGAGPISLIIGRIRLYSGLKSCPHSEMQCASSMA